MKKHIVTCDVTDELKTWKIKKGDPDGGHWKSPVLDWAKKRSGK